MSTSVNRSTTTPTVVFVHGAFSDASSWAGVIGGLQSDGVPVLAPPNPLRSLAGDAAYIAARVQQIDGPVLLVGHSYGGAVITVAGAAADNVVGLVYVAAFAPDEGESLTDIFVRFPNPPLFEGARQDSFPLNGTGETAIELSLATEAYPTVFAGGRPADAAAVAAVSQRPIAASIFEDQAAAAAWMTLPSWYIVGGSDKAIPPDAQRFMAERADARTIEVPDGSHVVMLTHPAAVADHIRTALLAVTAEVARSHQ